MEYYNKTLCVTFKELTEGDSPIIKAGTLRQNLKRGNIQCCIIFFISSFIWILSFNKFSCVS